MFQEISEAGYYTQGTVGSEPRACSRAIPREVVTYHVEFDSRQTASCFSLSMMRGKYKGMDKRRQLQ